MSIYKLLTFFLVLTTDLTASETAEKDQWHNSRNLRFAAEASELCLLLLYGFEHFIQRDVQHARTGEDKHGLVPCVRDKAYGHECGCHYAPVHLAEAEFA